MSTPTPVPASVAVCTSSETPLPVSSKESPSKEEDCRIQTAKSSEFSNLVDTYGNKFAVPDYTIKQIRDAIPKECYERNALRSLSYVFRDITLISCTFWLFHTNVTPEYIPSPGLRFVLWSVYGFLNGLFGTGIWVLAHECGHQAFSTSKIINDSVGFLLHSSLLVPYFSWKISHGKHHKATAHMDRDMVFVPRTRHEQSRRLHIPTEELHEVVQDTPIFTLSYIIARQLVGWPVYLLTNVTGHNCHERQPEGRGKGKKNGWFNGVNHFNPASPLYEQKDAKLILLSDIGITTTGVVLYLLGLKYGWTNLATWYLLPYLWVNGWLIAITFLQHTDPSLPHYKSGAWSFTRGAAATIDRDFGFIGRHLFHGIIDTHVLHHHVSTIPFYNAEKATEAIRPVMGRHYREETRDSRKGFLGFWRSMWANVRSCQWVEPTLGAGGIEKDVLFFRNRNGIGPRPAKL